MINYILFILSKSDSGTTTFYIKKKIKIVRKLINSDVYCSLCRLDSDHFSRKQIFKIYLCEHDVNPYNTEHRCRRNYDGRK